MKARFADEQIIKLLKEHEAGEGTADICWRYGISQATFLQIQIEVQRHGGVRRQEVEGLGS